MTLVVGVSPDDAGRDAVALGAVLSRLLGADIVLAHVKPHTYDYPSVANVDAEWEAFLEERASTAFASARQQLADRWGILPIEQVTVSHRSVSHGLVDAAETVGGSLIVLGPGHGGHENHAGHEGRIVLGSTAHALMHGSSIGMALAPEGFHSTAPAHIERVVVGFRDRIEARAALRWATEVVRTAGVGLELLTVVMRVTRMASGRLGRDPERAVLEALVEQEQRAQEQALAELEVPAVGAVVQGDTAEEAMDRFAWNVGDVFVVSASGLGALGRVFPGATSLKLLGAATVPALILPTR